MQYADSHPMIKFLEENRKELVFYGAGGVCMELLKQAREYMLPVRFIIDRDPNKRGNILRGGLK